MEGFYVFGGRNQKGEALGTLKLLRYDQGGMTWTYPSTKGLQPPARYGHSMVYSSEGGYVIIFGGRNNKMFQAQRTCCFNDINVLDLSHLSWCAVSTFGDPNSESRYAHSAALYQSQLIIFGGLHDYHFLDTGIRRLELDQEEVKSLQAIDIQNINLKRAFLGSQFTQLLEKFLNNQELETRLEKKSRKLPKTIGAIDSSAKIRSNKEKF